jgi:hypothetical protein
MDSVRIELTNGKAVTFYCETANPETVNMFLADHDSDSTLAIHGFGGLSGDFETDGVYFTNDGDTLMLTRSDVVSIEVA